MFEKIMIAIISLMLLAPVYTCVCLIKSREAFSSAGEIVFTAALGLSGGFGLVLFACSVFGR